MERADRIADQDGETILRQAIESLAKKHARGVNNCKCEYCETLATYIQYKIYHHREYKLQRDYGANNGDRLEALHGRIQELRKRKNSYL